MRKSLLQFAYMGAIALVGSVCFSACSDDLNDPEKSNNLKEAVTDIGGVPVNFVFNVSTSAADTRMDASTVQVDGKFRGISNARLIAYHLSSDGNIITKPGLGSGKEEPLKIFPEFASLVPASDTYTTSTRILELSMPPSTNSLLFYGRAPHSGNNLRSGKIDTYHSPDDDMSKFTMGYSQRISGANYSKFLQVGNMFAGIMTGFMDVGFKSNSINTADRDLYFWWDTTTNQPEDALVVGWRPSTTARMAGTDNSYKDYECFYGSSQRTDDSPVEEWVAKHITSQLLDAEETATRRNTRTGTDASDSPAKGNVKNHIYQLYRSNVTWKAYGLWKRGIDTNRAGIAEADKYPYEPSLSELGRKLGDAYNNMMKTTENIKELRAASSDAVLSTVKDLYQVISKIASAEPTDIREFVATKFAERLQSRIQLYFTFSTDVSASGVAWKSASDVTSTISDYANKAYEADLGTKIPVDLITANTDITGFPESYNIPAGGSLFDFTYNYGTSDSPIDKSDNVNYGGVYKFLDEIPNYDLGGSSDGTTHVTQENYVYPAELLYFGNSPVRVSAKQLDNNKYPSTSTDWYDATKWDTATGETNAAWSNGASHVTSDSKSVAMMYNINYGVALLETKVRVKANGDGVIYDNSSHFYTEADKAFPIDNNTVPFEVTGIIIGGQPQKVGWNYTATVLPEMTTEESAADKWDRLVYDNQVVSANVTNASNPSPAMYTLLLDNYTLGFNSGSASDGEQDDQTPVYVALELKNKLGNFMGQHNMVRKDGKFYLIGKLDLEAASKTVSGKQNYETVGARAAKDTYVMPPYNNTDGTSKNIARVFMQDYKTSVTLTIDENSLKKAYVTVPNLSASQVSLGLSVDINWAAGIDFGEVVLGDY